VLLTGASGGFGRAIASDLLGEGAHVVGVARDRARLQRALDEAQAATRADRPAVDASGGAAAEALAAPADVTDPYAVTRLFALVVRRFGRVDAVINGAGALVWAPVEDLGFSDWQRSLAVNLTGVFLCSQAAVRQMLEQAPGPGGVRGHIVQVVSGAGVHAWPHASAYAAAKHGVMGFSETLREEVGPRGIKVTTLLPGMARTDMTERPEFAERPKLVPTDIAHAVRAILTAAPAAVFTRVEVRHL